MNLYIRILILLFKSLFYKSKKSSFDVCHTNFYVSIVDLDVNFHMNNGRYLTIMDLGRVDLMLKAKVFWKLMLGGYYPVVASESIRFRRSLEPFQKYQMETFLESWDEKDFYMSQKFFRNGSLVAEGYIKARFKKRGRNGSVPTEELFQFLGETYKGPQLSVKAQALSSMEKLLCEK